jgi:hypothetical protein
MCLNCLSTAEATVAQAAAVAYALKRPVHRILARHGLLPQPDPDAADVRTVAFLRSLDLDPTEILGPDVVATADAWIPARRIQLARRTGAARVGFAAS